MRFEVFNLELREGLDSSFDKGRDEDPFDPVCHHLMVCEQTTHAVVGTYRMQTIEMASRGRGFYSDIEFDLSGLPEDVMRLSVEIGRACVARKHRSLRLLYLLWSGLAHYMAFNDKRYLFGCSSLTSQDAAVGHAVWGRLQNEGYDHPAIRISPRPEYALPEVYDQPASREANTPIPRLMRAYLSLGAKICGPPAIDRAFKTIDYLSLFDMERLDEGARRFFGYKQ